MRNMFGVKYKILVSSGELCAVFVSYLVLLLYLSEVINGVKISSVSVPSRVNSSSIEPVKLDCVFEFDPSENNLSDRELVIQWKLNNSTLLYQWINNGTTFINSTIKNRIDSNYRILPNTKPTNMPLTFITRSIDLTGHYTCKVSTFQGEDSEERLMQAFVPMDRINLNYELDADLNELNVTCSAEGIYPRPTIMLFVNQESQSTGEINMLERENHLYDINAAYSVPVDDLTPRTILNCTISLSEANYSDSTVLFFTKKGFEKYVSNASSDNASNSSLLKQLNSSGIGLQNTYNLNVLLLTTLLALIRL